VSETADGRRRWPDAEISPTALLAVYDLCTYFETDRGIVKAADGVSFGIEQDQILGLVGETGSGKSVTAASILRLVQPPGRVVSGRILFEGGDLLDRSEADMRRVRGSEIGLVVQNVKAAFNPLLPVGKQLANVYRTHRKQSVRDARRHAVDMLAAVGMPDPQRVATSYPHQLSGGMLQRVLLALVIGTSPRLILADEPTSGLDATLQVEVLDLLTRLVRERRASALLITHDFGVVARYCDKVAVMFAGRVVEYGDVAQFFSQPRHPYSARLLAALGWKSSLEASLGSPGEDVSVADLSVGCPYRARCPLATPMCAAEDPPMREIGRGQWAKCHHSERLTELIEAHDTAARH
jgi:peptide/nickel transport system ATP-binding protein